MQVIDGFDFEEELLVMFECKCFYVVGMYLDCCWIGGCMVNQWLVVFGWFLVFFVCLEEEGWIWCYVDLCGSCFWNLIEGDWVVMFGVFIFYEQQLLYDWIVGDW